MTFLEQLSILRRRWLYLALGTLVGFTAGFITAPGESADARRFEGTHLLLVDGGGNPNRGGLNLDQIELLVRSGALPDRVQERLREEGEVRFRTLVATADVTVRSVTLRATSTTPSSAEKAANYAAEELNATLAGVERAAIEEQRATATAQVEDLTADLAELDAQLLVVPPEDPARGPIQAQRDTTASALRDARAELDALDALPEPKGPLRTLEAAKGGPLRVEGWKLPESKPVRGAMIGAFGLVLGIFGALGSERLDTRVRNKQDAEAAFGLPVVAEIPPIPTGVKGRELLVATRPAAPFVEAYRSLRTVVLFAANQASPGDAAPTNGHVQEPGPPAMRAKVILITSPSAGEGKTTSVAHLAAVMAEFGKHVLVISADFRRPRVHELFGISREPGLSDVLEAGGGRVRLSDIQMSTNVEGVHLLPSGSPVNNPAQLLTETTQLIAAARSLFDFIIIDTPPLLVANDATELAAVADMVLLFAKADRTSREAARRSTETLRRIDAPLLGVVVVAAHDTPTAYGYYRYRYYAAADQGITKRRARRRKAEPDTRSDIPVGVAPERSTES